MATSSVGHLWWGLDAASRHSLAQVFDGALTDRQVQRLRGAGLPVSSTSGTDSVIRWFMGHELLDYLGVLRARHAMDSVDESLLNWRDAQWVDESRPGYAQLPGSSELVLVFTRQNNDYAMGWLRIRASGTAVSEVTPVANGSFQDCLAALHVAKFDTT